MFKALPIALLALLSPMFPCVTPASAKVPQVATDIAPVQGLVDRVMAGIGGAQAVLPPGASPHGYAMRPSEALALGGADLVVWIGPGLVPWLERGLNTLAADAVRLTLTEVPGTRLLPRREIEDFGRPSGGPEEDHEHEHGMQDPHAWLDPANGALWLGAIAEALAMLDPDHAVTYRANAAAGQTELTALTVAMTAALAPAQDRSFVVFHDTTQYFEDRFGLTAAGAISLSDASTPGPAHLSALRKILVARDVTCIFAEPQFAPSLVATVAEGTNARTAVLDPLGSRLAAGPAFYPDLLRGLARDIGGCLAPAK